MPRYSDGNLAAYRAINYHIQGMAAYIFKIGAIQIAQAGLWGLVRMVVHDEFVLSLPFKALLNDVIQAGKIERKRITYTLSGEIYGEYWGH